MYTYFQCTALTSTLQSKWERLSTFGIQHTGFETYSLTHSECLGFTLQLGLQGNNEVCVQGLDLWVYLYRKILIFNCQHFFPWPHSLHQFFPAPSTRAIHSWLHTLVQTIASYVNCLTSQDHGIKNRSMVVNACITTCMPRHAQSTHKTLYLSPSFHNDCWSAHNQTPSPSCNHLGYKSSGGIQTVFTASSTSKCSYHYIWR